jgi:hypothetical protein
MPQKADPVSEFLRSKEGLALNRAFLKINDPQIREKIVSLVKAMAQAEGHRDTAVGASASETSQPLNG